MIQGQEYFVPLTLNSIFFFQDYNLFCHQYFLDILDSHKQKDWNFSLFETYVFDD